MLFQVIDSRFYLFESAHRFVGLASMSITDGIQNTMKIVCEILADSTDGVSASIKIENFKEIYGYLAERY